MSDWGGCIASAKIEGQWMNGPWVITNPDALLDKVAENKNWHAGDGECAAIAQWTMDMPLTSQWRPGVKVLGNEDYLEKMCMVSAKPDLSEERQLRHSSTKCI